MRNKIVFASDFHLGIDSKNTSKDRELLIVEWLLSLRSEMKELYLVGDIFDYWFEYKSSIPKGYSDFMNALRLLRNDGIKITFFTGNHDMWMFDYFTEEFGIEVLKKPQVFEFYGAKFFVAHGDGLGPGDHVYKIVKKIFSNRICQALFSLIHPSLALRMMRSISQRDAGKYTKPDTFKDEEEWLIQFANQYQQREEMVDFFIFGHRHLMYEYDLKKHGKVVNLGDWISFLSYAVWDGEKLDLLQYKKNGI
ncbi:UDP-2,3-diacylglucosamine diphosphatase [Saprospiraceae bacterium]|nr:UDP-2,3-diacylglucosamine diphosphatase [Saprospiraceae bacterium]